MVSTRRKPNDNKKMENKHIVLLLAFQSEMVEMRLKNEEEILALSEENEKMKRKLVGGSQTPFNNESSQDSLPKVTLLTFPSAMFDRWRLTVRRMNPSQTPQPTPWNNRRSSWIPLYQRDNGS